MAYEDIVITRDGKVLTITINRPESLNVLRMQTRRECISALLEAEGDKSVRAVVITGAGKKAFSGGADVREGELQSRSVVNELKRASDLRRDLPRLCETLEKPVVAAINGYCFGAGLELALGCTFRIAAESAKLGQPEIRLGMIPGSGGTQRLSRLVGLGWAMHIILTGEPVTARQALSIGLVTEVVPDERLSSRARELGGHLATLPSLALHAAREAVLRSMDSDLISGLEIERYLSAIVATSGDKNEGLTAFLEKRQPIFGKDESV